MMVTMGDKQHQENPMFRLIDRDGDHATVQLKGSIRFIQVSKPFAIDCPELRPNEHVFAREALDTLIGKPVTDER